jgi:hypothetical protein
MGPWSHGDWARNSANATIGNINFGDSISGFYQKNIEANFSATFEKITVKAKTNYQKPTCLILELRNGKLMMLGLRKY